MLYPLRVIDEVLPFVGDFRGLGHGRSDGPSLRSAVRAQDPANAHWLVDYLRAGTVLAATATLVHDILSPDNAVIGGLHLLTDGRWLWYSDLAHWSSVIVLLSTRVSSRTPEATAGLLRY